MLSVAQNYLREFNRNATLKVFGQELNPESYAIFKRDMLGNKQNEIGNGTSSKPDQIGESINIYGDFGKIISGTVERQELTPVR